MDPATLQALIQAGIAIFIRHFNQTGEKLTDAEVYAALQRELADGQTAIAQWFTSKGLPIPQ